ncbi:MAG: 5-oxoprolinase subunit PxpB [Oscillospiraceae bacterium]|jgi:inhibitor of KinA|nr:5-oxoprolinase subunit PxpB [Oscillospiraceae bacterium]
MSKDYAVLPSGDRAFTVRFGDKIDPAVNDRVASLAESLARKPIDGVIEFVPTYAALLVIISPERLSLKRAISAVSRRVKRLSDSSSLTANSSSTVELPVCYGGKYGEDIQFVADHAGLTTDEVIRVHTEPVYRVYMLGFMPGFPYLGGLDERIETPRLETPRAVIPAGSVGIGGKQTGVYPLASPGGWRLIGRTPVKLYDSARANPVLLKAGDFVKFKPVAAEEFIRMGGEA